jgi:hypothetical protein
MRKKRNNAESMGESSHPYFFAFFRCISISGKMYTAADKGVSDQEKYFFQYQKDWDIGS